IYNPLKIQKDLNDNSLVLKLIYNDSKFLFTGDLTSNLEDDLVRSFDLESDILKVGHHGSKYSTSEVFLKAVSPNCAVISVGQNNYGHPDEGVLKLLDNNGVRILRTDLDGDIVFHCNEDGIFLEK
ncbi:MAG: hypothetical protein PHF88_01820, partial [Candidatus Pacebacteria bacterium]|nr:hypothetical protein [Candidatus Paceibacterota bacterium]